MHYVNASVKGLSKKKKTSWKVNDYCLSLNSNPYRKFCLFRPKTGNTMSYNLNIQNTIHLVGFTKPESHFGNGLRNLTEYIYFNCISLFMPVKDSGLIAHFRF